MAEFSPRDRLDQDLGLGGKLSERSPARLLNRDGTFIVAGPKFGDGILMLPLRATY